MTPSYFDRFSLLLTYVWVVGCCHSIYLTSNCWFVLQVSSSPESDFVVVEIRTKAFWWYGSLVLQQLHSWICYGHTVWFVPSMISSFATMSPSSSSLGSVIKYTICTIIVLSVWYNIVWLLDLAVSLLSKAQLQSIHGSLIKRRAYWWWLLTTINVCFG